jgi:hypothetical protein
MNNNEFKCAVCEEIFKKDWSDEEAIKELCDTFGEEYTEEECEVVCDDCYKKMIGEYPIEEFKKSRL